MLSIPKGESLTPTSKHTRLEISKSQDKRPSPRYPILRERVASALHELGQGPITAAEQARLHRNYITDILLGRKKSVNGADRLERLARALGVSPAYLTGTKQAQNRIVVPTGGGLQLQGVIAEGVKRRKPASAAMPTVSVQSDARYPGAQGVFAVSGDDLQAIGANAGSWLLVVDAQSFLKVAQAYRPGQLVVCSLTDTDGEELVVRRVITFPDRVELHPVSGDGTVYTMGRHPRGRRLSVRAVVLKAIQELA